MLFSPVVDEDTKIDLYAGNERVYIDLLPLWEALGDRKGTFYTASFLRHDGTKRIDNDFVACNPLVVTNYKDLNDLFIAANDCALIMYETENNIETRGLLNIVSLFLCFDSRLFNFRKASYKASVEQVFSDEDAARKIIEFCKGKEPQYITHVGDCSVGIMYMGWGDKAKLEIKRSQASLRRLGYKYPVKIIDESSIDVSPFDKTKARGFQFRAGRIKPNLFDLSPFDFTLYIDADTRFIQPIHSIFEMLLEYDMIVTEEKLTLAQLYNKKLAGWELNMLERDVTLVELNSNGAENFVNSGVIFFRKNTVVGNLFSDWFSEWMRFQEWDEQLALMRAIHKNKAKIKYLPHQWNDPSLNAETVIFHNYGRGVARQDV